MAKIKIAGKAVIIRSEVKYDDIATVQKYRPNALIMKDEKENPIFKVGIGSPSFNAYGASFDGKTSDGYAEITIVRKENDEEPIVDKYGAAILNLTKIEESLSEVLAEIEAEKEAILANIEVV